MPKKTDRTLGYQQSQGQRQYQQDYFSVLGFAAGTGEKTSLDYSLLVLADGMGGHAAGEVASEIAVEAFVETFKSLLPEDELSERLAEAILASNRAVKAETDLHPEYAGMGCTLVAVHYDQFGLSFVSVGDSPLWIARESRLDRVNANHSMGDILDRMVSSGEISRHEADFHGQRNALTSAIIGEPLDPTKRESVDLWTYDPILLQKGERVIIASDGVQSLAEDQIYAIARNADLSCQEVADELVAQTDALHLHDQDNTTVLVFEPGSTEVAAPQKRAKAKRSANKATRVVRSNEPSDENSDSSSSMDNELFESGPSPSDLRASNPTIPLKPSSQYSAEEQQAIRGKKSKSKSKRNGSSPKAHSRNKNGFGSFVRFVLGVALFGGIVFASVYYLSGYLNLSPAHIANEGNTPATEGGPDSTDADVDHASGATEAPAGSADLDQTAPTTLPERLSDDAEEEPLVAGTEKKDIRKDTPTTDTVDEPLAAAADGAQDTVEEAAAFEDPATEALETGAGGVTEEEEEE